MRDFYWTDENEMAYKVMVDKMVKEKKLNFVKRLMFTKYEGMKAEEGKGTGVFVEQPASVHIYKKLAP